MIVYPMHRKGWGLFYLRKPLPITFIPLEIEIKYNITEKVKLRPNIQTRSYFPVHPNISNKKRNRLLITFGFNPWPWR